MVEVELLGGPLEWRGALEVVATPGGAAARRLPAWARAQLPDLTMDVVQQLPAGVRLCASTTTTSIRLTVQLTHLHQLPKERTTAAFDLVVDGQVVHSAATTTGHLIEVGPAPGAVVFTEGPATTITFDALESGRKAIELWLPQGTAVEVLSLEIDEGASWERPDRGGPRWTHYGSSISHCVAAQSPTRTWPAQVARRLGLDGTNLGFGGQCMLDPFVARTIRDHPAEVISLKVAANLYAADTMALRTFGPALDGFLDTIREGQPTTPMVVISPIGLPVGEDTPGPLRYDPEGMAEPVPRPDDLQLGVLTLGSMRSRIAEVVTRRQAAGDANLHYLDGRQLFDVEDFADLPDRLHPNDAGNARMAERCLEALAGPGGPFAGLG